MIQNNKDKSYALQRFDKWAIRFKDDFRAMEIILKEDGPVNTICFLAQQAAEKLFKGFLSYHKTHIGKTHKLEILLDACVLIDKEFSELNDAAVFLDNFYIETRYPGDYPEFSLKDAKQAYQHALNIQKFILKKIKN